MSLTPLKRKNVLTHGAKWINFENITLSETSQTQKDKYYIIPFPWGTYSQQIHRDRK